MPMVTRTGSRWTGAVVLALSILGSAPLLAQDTDARRGQEIAKAKNGKLDAKHAKKANIDGKKFDLTPADFRGIQSLDQLKSGVYLGQLENDATMTDGVSLEPGKYDLYLAQEGGVWKAWAAKNGKLKEAKNVEERPDTPADMDPQFSRGSGCWWMWLIFTGFNVCW